jgi:hypothetical protein
MQKITIKLPAMPYKRRAIELYSANSPFKGRAEVSKKAYTRKDKHKKQVDKDLGL